MIATGVRGCSRGYRGTAGRPQVRCDSPDEVLRDGPIDVRCALVVCIGPIRIDGIRKARDVTHGQSAEPLSKISAHCVSCADVVSNPVTGLMTPQTTSGTRSAMGLNF